MQQTFRRWSKRSVLAIVALPVLLAIGSYLSLVWGRYRTAQLDQTQEHRLFTDHADPVRSAALALLANLRARPEVDSLRFAAMPSFKPRWFALSVATRSGRGVGEAIVTTQSGEVLRHLEFEVPEEQLRRFLGRWDELSDRYPGDGRALVDGNPIVFERRRGARITSGEGNSPCHEGVLGDLAAQTFARYVPELQDLRNPKLPALLKQPICTDFIFSLR